MTLTEEYIKKCRLISKEGAALAQRDISQRGEPVRKEVDPFGSVHYFFADGSSAYIDIFRLRLAQGDRSLYDA
ncbi:MAG: hypothetical protein LBU25_09770 [Treponema sp.]|jgi:hypothetical protein|nr:hypothetical protein [Treponema sp.]